MAAAQRTGRVFFNHSKMKHKLLIALGLAVAATAFGQPVGPAPIPLRPPVPNLKWIPKTGGSTSQPIAFAQNTKEESFKLLSGNVIQGKFLGYDPAKGLSWRHPDIQPDLQIQPAKLAQINFAMRPAPANARTHNGILEFANGDRLTGEVLAMEKGKLRINTWYAGELAVDPGALRVLTPGVVSGNSLFAGIQGTKGWTATKSGTLSWEYADGGFESKTSGPLIGRKFEKLPNKVRVEFDLEWGPGSPSLYVGFLTDNLTSYSSGSC